MVLCCEAELGKGLQFGVKLGREFSSSKARKGGQQRYIVGATRGRAHGGARRSRTVRVQDVMLSSARNHSRRVGGEMRAGRSPAGSRGGVKSSPRLPIEGVSYARRMLVTDS